MRRTNLFLCLLATIATGCADGGRALEPRTDPRLRERLLELGFRPDMIVDQGASFLVEGDIEIAKQDLAGGAVPAGHGLGLRPVLGGASFQYIGDRTVIHQEYSDRPINVYITSLIRNSHPDWARSVRDAMGHWSGLGGFNLKFVEVTSQSAANIVVGSYTYDADEVAKSAWPTTGGSPGAYVWINLGYRRGLGSGGQPVYFSKVFHMVHELGHTIGFRHSNYLLLAENGSDSIGTHLIPNTRILDSLSVMNGGTNRRTWTEFSSGDRIAARAVYMGSVRVVPDLENGHPRLNWNVEAGAYEYRIFRESGYPFPITTEIGSASWGTFTDYGIAATVARQCGMAEFPSYVYFVLAYFPEGTVTRRVAPEVCVY